jgi:nucleotide-binding universal stress UspA family protein
VAVEAQHGVAEAIIDAADEHDALLVVMGTRGNTGIRSLLLGSVSHAVAHHAHRPLLIVPSQPLADARSAGARR